MKKMWVVLIALALCTGTLAAQAVGHEREKKANDEISISQAITIGGQTLAPGKYKVSCDEKEVTFTRVSNNEKVLTLPCKGKEMVKKSENTEVHSSLNPAGVRVVDKLLIRGSNVEHVF